MPSGLDEITRKEMVTKNTQAKGRMSLRKPVNCLSFYHPMVHRPQRSGGQMERPSEVSLGQAGPCLRAPATTLAAEKPP